MDLIILGCIFQNEQSGQQLAGIFNSLYGTEQIPEIQGIKITANARIGRFHSKRLTESLSNVYILGEEPI